MSNGTVCATGHRNAGVHVELIEDWLSHHNFSRAITGMAIGWDTSFALAAISLGIPLVAAVPFPQQPNLWSAKDQELYYDILNNCMEVEFLYDKYSTAAFHKRNEWMVDRSNHVLAWWSGRPSGTGNCVAYATRKGVPVTNLYAS